MNADQAATIADKQAHRKATANTRKVYGAIQKGAERGGRHIFAWVSCNTKRKLINDGFDVRGCRFVMVRW